MLHSSTPAVTHFFRKLSIILRGLWNYSWDLPRSERYHLFFPAEEIVDMKSSRRIFRVGELVTRKYFLLRKIPARWRNLIYPLRQRRVGYIVTWLFVNDFPWKILFATNDLFVLPGLARQIILCNSKSLKSMLFNEYCQYNFAIKYMVPDINFINHCNRETISSFLLVTSFEEFGSGVCVVDTKSRQHSRLMPIWNKGCKRRVKEEDEEERMAPTRYANTRAADTDWVVPLRSTYSPFSPSRGPHLRRLYEHTNTTNFIDRRSLNDFDDQ